MHEIEFYSRYSTHHVLVRMSENGGPPLTVFHMFEKYVGRRVLVVVDSQYGYEGVLAAITQDPPGIWLSDADAVILRATIAQPFPQVVSREDRSEIFVNVKNIQRLEVLHKGK